MFVRAALCAAAFAGATGDYADTETLEAAGITGLVPSEWTDGLVRRRMFAAELDEFYDLQIEKDRLVEEWFALDRHYAGSDWSVDELIQQNHH